MGKSDRLEVPVGRRDPARAVVNESMGDRERSGLEEEMLAMDGHCCEDDVWTDRTIQG